MAFEKIVGHESIIQRLISTFRRDHVPSAYLFVGQEGIGKSGLVKEFARLMNCRTNEICHQCDSCRMFDNDSHPDFHVIQPSGKDIRISQIHSLIEQLSLKPAYARKRVVLVKSAHRLNQESANSFLKILEEPPLNTLIILMTADENQLLETIVSRCQKVLFSPLTRSQLKRIIDEKFQLDGEELEFVLNYSQGRVRKDFLEKVSPLLNMRSQVLRILLDLPTEKMVDYYHLIEQWLKQDFQSYFLEFCSAWIRDFICLKNQETEKLINRDMVDELRAEDIRLTHEQLQDIFDLIIETELAIQANASKALALEALLVQFKQIFWGALVI
ncbi:MAG: DNA polymerase III subunit delta' [Proteobacteria bacterium]|nr:DNA polymerase III subunit delta' [Pseudomonadota bacterium]